MTVKKITLASLILFTLTACSSGGSSNNSNGDLQNQLTQANAKLAESEKAKTKAEQAKLNSEKAKQAVENQLNSAKADLITAQQNLQKAQADKNTTAEQLKTAQANLTNAENAKQAVENQLNAAKVELAAAQNNLQQAQADKNMTAEQLKTAQSNLENSEKAKQAVENQLNAAKADLMTAQQNLQKAQADKNTTAEQLKTAQANLTNAENAKQAVENQLNAAKVELATAQAEKAKLEETLANKKAVIDEIVKKTEEILSQRHNQQIIEENLRKQEIVQNLANAKNELTQKESYLQSATQRLVNAQETLQRLERENASEEELSSARNAVWNADMDKSQAENQVSNQKNYIIDLENWKADVERHLVNLSNTTGFQSVMFDEKLLPMGMSKHPFINLSADKIDGIWVGNHYVYLTPDVLVQGRDNTAFWNDEKPEQRSFRVQGIWGSRTAELPHAGIVTYVGKGFNADNIGTLNYQVNFSEKTGSGSLTDFNNGIANIQLVQGKIEDGEIKSQAIAGNINGQYSLGFYGQDARTIAGEVYMPSTFEGGVKTNGFTAEKYKDTNRGTVFGIAGERQ